MIVVINGAPGTGKTVTAKLLFESTAKSALIDGDWLLATNPHSHSENSQLRYKNIATIAINYHENGFTNVFISFAYVRPEDLSEQSDLLKMHYGKIPLGKLAKMLNTTESGVQHKASRLNLKMQYNLENKKIDSWKTCNDFDNYEISRNGIIRNKSTNRTIKSVLKNGYYGVRLNKNGHTYFKSVHRLTAVTYLGSIEGMEVNHMDSNPLNNNLNNLEILTKELHRVHSKSLKKYVGEKVNTAKLTEEDVKEIRKLAEEGLTQREIAKRYKLYHSTVGRIIRRESWNHID
jgi:hypothetical protein